MKNARVTVITVTDGKESLWTLFDSIQKQKIPVEHIVLMDGNRDEKCTENVVKYTLPDEFEDEFYYRNMIILPKFSTTGKSNASALRAIGLMAATTELVTFADDDVNWEEEHLESMITQCSGHHQWAFCKRNIWAKLPDGQFEYLGVDDFESVGEKSKLPYKTINNNCMMFKRRYGTSAACLYRETQDLNDDRLMYEFLTKYAPVRGETNLATVNQVCPDRLVKFFRDGCTKIIGE